MFQDQLKNFAMQLQGISKQIMDVGLQFQMMMNSYGILLQNLSQQISNISMEIFNIGMNMSNLNMPMPNNNLLNIPNIPNNNLDTNLEKINMCIEFDTLDGRKTIINCNDNITVEELLNRFLIKANYDKEKKDDFFYLYNGHIINPQEKNSIKNYGIEYLSVIRVIDKRNFIIERK